MKTEADINESKPVIVSGVKGMRGKSFTKKFKNWAAFEKWSYSDDFGNYEVYTVQNA